ncbi:helix-turn-helix domain-containing protein [Sutcliffiella cohnii]|uniref:helix-turn-helix domain-containing protein n=1 Tax=Sutcliffiella cohnii TaxID=33932 RepID=UPI00082D50E8|nr:helix-turn-helix transcriptional regulator [Sutcliffiella cohnii]
MVTGMKFKDIECLDNVERLLVLRKRLNKKQYEFAREIGVSPNYLLSVENYKKPFTKSLKQRIEKYLEMENYE